jgi:hypothetical protein
MCVNSSDMLIEHYYSICFKNSDKLCQAKWTALVTDHMNESLFDVEALLMFHFFILNPCIRWSYVLYLVFVDQGCWYREEWTRRWCFFPDNWTSMQLYKQRVNQLVINLVNILISFSFLTSYVSISCAIAIKPAASTTNVFS